MSDRIRGAHAHDASVIVPTRSRPELVGRVLEALAGQTHPRERWETIVVTDDAPGATDAGVERFASRLPVRLLRTEKAGASAARNRGAAEATGEALLFLDDDVIPSPGLVAAHVEARRIEGDIVGVGPYDPDDPPGAGLFPIVVRNWWEERFAALAAPGHRIDARDVLSGNLSVGADRFRRVGGFDESLRGREDWELGIRLLRDGATVRFLPGAAAKHLVRETMNLGAAFARAFVEGEADARILRMHPDDAPLFAPAVGGGPLLARAPVRAARDWPVAGGAIAKGIAALLPLLEKAKMRRSWRHLYGTVRLYHYALGRLAGERALAGSAPAARARPNPPVEITVDLAQGIEAAERAVDDAKPDAVRVVIRGRAVLTIPPAPGAEPLRGAHLRPLLTGPYGPTLARAMRDDESLRNPPGA